MAMASLTQLQIAWTLEHICAQVQSAVDTIPLCTDAAVQAFALATVHRVVGAMDVTHALLYYTHLQDTGALHDICSKDRIQCLFDHFYACAELELATRYA
jgi:hypothetical protein